MFNNELINKTIELYDNIAHNEIPENLIYFIKNDDLNDDLINYLNNNDKSVTFVQSLKYSKPNSKYFNHLFSISNKEELNEIFNLCCYARENELFKLLIKKFRIKPNQEQLELYLNEAEIDFDLYKILKYCLENNLNKMNLNDLLNIDDEKIIDLLKEYGYDL